MKKILIPLFTFLFFSGLFAQEEENVGWVARFGIAGGFAPTFLFPNLDPLNKELGKLGFEKVSESGLVSWGGGGYAYIMLIDNLRVGGLGLSGSSISSGVMGGIEKYNTEVVYNYGLGGLTIEYTIPAIKVIAISVGGIVGIGSSSVQIFRNKGKIDWNDVWLDAKNLSGTSKSSNTKFYNNFVTIAPTLNFDFPVNRFISLRLGGGYIFSFNDEWRADNDAAALNVPPDLKSTTFFVQTGIFFGFFAF
jgi:hypothetical protein